MRGEKLLAFADECLFSARFRNVDEYTTEMRKYPHNAPVIKETSRLCHRDFLPAFYHLRSGKGRSPEATIPSLPESISSATPNEMTA